jgi:propanol-preferring alcohol dehydrogenase
MRDGSLTPPINPHHARRDPEAIDKLREGGVVGRFIAMYEE